VEGTRDGEADARRTGGDDHALACPVVAVAHGCSVHCKKSSAKRG
jgi:hypothetical protein